MRTAKTLIRLGGCSVKPVANRQIYILSKSSNRPLSLYHFPSKPVSNLTLLFAYPDSKL